MRTRLRVTLAFLLNIVIFFLYVWPVLADPIQGGG